MSGTTGTGAQWVGGDYLQVTTRNDEDGKLSYTLLDVNLNAVHQTDSKEGIGRWIERARAQAQVAAAQAKLAELDKPVPEPAPQPTVPAGSGSDTVDDDEEE